MPEESEITNAVLKEMIISLTKQTDSNFASITKITDERLGNLKDTMSEIKLLMSGFATTAQLEETKKDWNRMFEAHSKDDEKNFGGLIKGQEEAKKEQRKTQDTLLRWGAVLAALFFILSFLSPVILKYFFHI